MSVPLSVCVRGGRRKGEKEGVRTRRGEEKRKGEEEVGEEHSEKNIRSGM